MAKTWTMWSRFGRFFLVGFVFFAPEVFAAQISDLSTFIKELKKLSPEVRAIQERLEISRRSESSALGALLPSLDLTSQLESDHESEPSPIDSSSSSIGLSANLYNSHLDWYNYQTARLEYKTAALQLYKETSDFLLRGISLYLDYSDRYVALGIAEQRKQLVDEQFRNSRRSYRSGTSTRLNFLRLQADAKSADFEVRRARTDMEKARIRLEALFPKDLSDFSIQPLMFDDAFKLPRVEGEVEVSNHPEFEIKMNQKKIATFEVKKAERAYWPQISLGTEWKQNYSGYWVEDSTPYWSRDWVTTLSLTFNLFDGGQLSNALANKKSQFLISESELETAKWNLGAEIKNLHSELKRLEDQTQTANEILKIQNQVFNSISQEYRVGNIGYLDFTNSLNARLSARMNLQNSVSSYLKSYYSWLYHKGVLINP